jgi:hypothetical protein
MRLDIARSNEAALTKKLSDLDLVISRFEKRNTQRTKVGHLALACELIYFHYSLILAFFRSSGGPQHVL